MHRAFGQWATATQLIQEAARLENAHAESLAILADGREQMKSLLVQAETQKRAAMKQGVLEGETSAMQALIPQLAAARQSTPLCRSTESLLEGASAGGRGRRLLAIGLGLRPRWTQMRRGQAFGSPGASAQLQPSLLCAGARFEHLTITAAFGEWQSMTREITYVEAMMELGTQLDNVTTIANSEVEARGAASRMMSRMKEKHHAAERAAEKARYSMRDRFQEVARGESKLEPMQKGAGHLGRTAGPARSCESRAPQRSKRLAKERDRQQKTHAAAQRTQLHPGSFCQPCCATWCLPQRMASRRSC